MSNLHVHREVKQVCEQVTTYTFTLSEHDAKCLRRVIEKAYWLDETLGGTDTGDFVARLHTALTKAGFRASCVSELRGDK